MGQRYDLTRQYGCFGWRHTLLGCFTSNIDLKQYEKAFSLFSGIPVQRLCQVQAIYALYTIKWTDHFACLVVLLVTDHVPAQTLRMEHSNLGQGFLNTILAKIGHS